MPTDALRLIDFIPVAERAAIVAGTSTYDATADFNTAIAWALQQHCMLELPNGTVRCLGDINYEAAHTGAVDIYGHGMSASCVLLDGTGIVDGFHIQNDSSPSVTYCYGPRFRDFTVQCANGAPRGITVTDMEQVVLERLWLRDAAGHNALFDSTLMSAMVRCLVTGGGSATEAQVRVDNSTTFLWDQNYISGGAGGCISGIDIDRSPNVMLSGGAIESTGVAVRVAADTDTSVGCVVGAIRDMDFENATGHYIEFGYGLSGSANVRSWEVRSCAGYPSGSTTIASAIKAKNTVACAAIRNNFATSTTGGAIHYLEATIGFQVSQHRNLFGNTTPWVMLDGTHRLDAGPLTDWDQDTILPNVQTAKTVTGATPSALTFTQGGINGIIRPGNGGATTMTALTDGWLYTRILIWATNANTTLSHSTSINGFFLIGGVNLLLDPNRMYEFTHNGNYWVQLS